jgi:hypothetical protein
MAEPKTKATKKTVESFLATIKDKSRRADCEALVKLMKKITKAEPTMWGSSIVGFGTYHYVYASGREGDWPITGFSPRSQNLTLYIRSGFAADYGALLEKLGKHKTAKSCLYVNRLEDIHFPTLEKLITRSVAEMKKKHA